MLIEDHLSALGCIVVGVAANVTEGLKVVDDPSSRLDGAVLDVNLAGEKVYPVATRLAERGVPFIFATGYGRAGIVESFQHVPTLAKPFRRDALEQALATVVTG